MKKLIVLSIIATFLALSSLTIYAGAQPQPSEEIPTLNEWGFIVIAVMMGVAGIYAIFKRK
jgi:hypothetical protein